MKKYEYVQKEWFNDRQFDLIKSLNFLGDMGYFIVSIRYVPMLDNQNDIWKYIVLFAKEV